MPEPDFDQIAQQLTDRAFPVAVVTRPEPPFKTRQQLVDLLAEQLRLVWNARGAADLATIEATITYSLSGTDSGLVKNLDHALRKLDR